MLQRCRMNVRSSLTSKEQKLVMWNKIETVTFADDKVVQATELSKGSTKRQNTRVGIFAIF